MSGDLGTRPLVATPAPTPGLQHRERMEAIHIERGGTLDDVKGSRVSAIGSNADSINAISSLAD